MSTGMRYMLAGVCAGLAMLSGPTALWAQVDGSGVEPIAIPEDAKPGAEVLVTLSTGETLRCVIVEVKAETVVLKHPVLGKIEAPRQQITQVQIETPAPPPPPPPPPPGFFEGWKGSVQGGVNGSEGNSENLSLRFGINLERITESMETRVASFYAYATDGGEKTKSRGELDVRNDWLFKDSPWGFFAQGKMEYDEFQDWDWRASGFAGPTYTFFKTDESTFRVRAGAGGSREFGGDNSDITPEALLGLDYSRKFQRDQSFFVSTELLPDLDDTGEYRWNTKAGYEIVIDPESKLSLRLGIDQRYDSNPSGDSDRTDIDYFALLAWSF